MDDFFDFVSLSPLPGDDNALVPDITLKETTAVTTDAFTAASASAPLISDVDLLAGLNPEQEKAVLHDEGPLLILAGAGSGKTRVITYRIAYLIRVRHVYPSAILAITFTNKAANEMKERIVSLIGDEGTRMWVGTFHAMFARILRRHAELIGYTSSYAILDSDDQLRVVKQILKDMELNDKIFQPRGVLSEISKSKNDMVTPDAYARDAGSDFRRQKIAKIYERYNEHLRTNNAMDFDDILFYAVRLLKDHPDVLTFYQDKFRYFMVDEYQDTNHAQYLLIQMLAKRSRNLCVVGDDDQSIYSFRGANITNILNFEKDFKDALVIKLEQNYRSTSTILDAANGVISNNKRRKKKTLRTVAEKGDKITYLLADNHGAEAYFCAEKMRELVKSGTQKYSDMAVLYRMNALSRTVESALRDRGIPYRVFGGLRFYDRKEIKDILAYLRLTMNGADNYAFSRIINVPKRGIGDTTVEKVLHISDERNMPCLEVCRHAEDFAELSRVAGKLGQFAEQIDEYRDKVDENQMKFAEFVEYVQDTSGVMNEIIEQREKKGETVDRVENLRELLSEAVEYENRRKAQIEFAATLSEEEIKNDPYLASETSFSTDLRGILLAYLENAALYSEGDNEDNNGDFVRLMTIHSAKGLEFGTVFLIGVEESIFPSSRSSESESDLEEERRLMYVAITRAKKNLTIVSARSRILFGQTQAMKPSRFINEIDAQYMNSIGTSREGGYDAGENPLYRTRRSGEGSGYSFGSSGGYRDSGMSYGKGNSGYGDDSAASSNYRKNVFKSTFSAPVAEKKSPATNLSPDTISKGMKVTHPRFGEGLVVSVEKVAGDALVCVDFDGIRKNMLLNKAGLQK